MTDDGLLLSDDDLEELTEEELAEYESLLAGELGGAEMDWRWRSKARELWVEADVRNAAEFVQRRYGLGAGELPGRRGDDPVGDPRAGAVEGLLQHVEQGAAAEVLLDDETRGPELARHLDRAREPLERRLAHPLGVEDVELPVEPEAGHDGMVGRGHATEA